MEKDLDNEAGITGAAGGDIQGEAKGIDRLNNFSDAVFAVAITLLILTLDVPQVPDPKQLPSALNDLWPKFQGFIISFVIIGAFWISHHVIFNFIERHRPGLLWLNLLFLMGIVILPFSTDLMSEYHSVLVVVLYDLNMVAVSLSLLILWWYVSYKYKLVNDTITQETRWHLLLNYITMSIIFMLSAGIAFLNVSASQYFYFILIPTGILVEHTHKRNLKAAR